MWTIHFVDPRAVGDPITGCTPSTVSTLSVCLSVSCPSHSSRACMSLTRENPKLTYRLRTRSRCQEHWVTLVSISLSVFLWRRRLCRPTLTSYCCAAVHIFYGWFRGELPCKLKLMGFSGEEVRDVIKFSSTGCSGGVWCWVNEAAMCWLCQRLQQRDKLVSLKLHK